MNNNNSESENCSNSRKNSFIQAVKDILNQNQDKNHISNSRPVTCKRPKRCPSLKRSSSARARITNILGYHKD